MCLEIARSSRTEDARPIRIVVIECEPVLLQRLAVLREEISDFELVGAATTPVDGIAIASALRPDVVLVDNLLPDCDGIQLCDQLQSQLPAASIIILSVDTSDEVILRAVESGACGLITKTAPDHAVVDAILRAGEGEFLLPRSVTLRLFRKERDLRRAEVNPSRSDR